MHKLYIVAALLIGHAAIGQTKTEIPSKVESVTVYPIGAQVERSASKFLTAGPQLLVFTGLASELDPSSISVAAGGNVNVLSVSSGINYLKPGDKPKALVQLEDSLRTYEFDLKFNQNMQGVYTEERKMILANQRIGWDKSEFVIEDLEDLSDFYRDRLADIMLKEMELQEKQGKLNEHIRRLRAQLSEFNTRLNRSTGEIVVEVNVPASGNAAFTLRYMVQNAGWIPSYNINVSEVDRPLQVSYNAKVFQNTGVDWNGVSLVLTNANPHLSGTKPEIHPWRLYFIQDQTVLYEGKAMSNKSYRLDAPESLSIMDSSMDDEYVNSIDYPVNEAVTQFRIATKHNIPANGKSQVINIDVFTVPAQYQYYTAPKFDPTAFLIARVGGFEQYDLLPGEANLFLANTYVGQAFIDPSITGDTLDLSLGRDQSIVVKRKKINEFSAARKLGSSTKESIGIEISVKNSKSANFELVIEDQVPISTDKEIEVTVGEVSGATREEATGKLRWKKIINANATENVVFKYDVKYPTGRKINL